MQKNMWTVQINNQTELKIDKVFVRKTVKTVLAEKDVGEHNVSVAFVENETIRELNRKYRKQDKATDVLSFEGDGEIFSGEIVIAPHIIKQRGECFKDDLKDVLTHSILHLMGYDHVKQSERVIMRAEEKRLKDILK